LASFIVTESLLLGLFFLMLGIPFPLLLSLPVKSFVYMESQRSTSTPANRNATSLQKINKNFKVGRKKNCYLK
jgi:hypothetical protein